MTPVYSEKWGDCFACGVASILELPLSETPTVPTGYDDFCESMHRRGITTEAEWLAEFEKWLAETREQFASDFVRVWQEWFAERGITCESFVPPVPTKGYAIAGCQDGPYTHTLVLLDGEIVHDPERPEHRRNQPWKITSIHKLSFCKGIGSGFLLVKPSDSAASPCFLNSRSAASSD